MYFYFRLNKNGKILRVFKEQNELKNYEKMGLVKISEGIYNQYMNSENKEKLVFNNGQLIEPTKPQPTLDELKQLKMLEIREQFQKAVKYGVIDFIIPSSGIKVQVDARRNTSNNDLQNVEGLINLIQVGILNSPILYKCYDNNKYEMNLQDLIALRYALMGYGLQLYQKKHYLEDLIQNAQTKEELEQIKW